MSDARIVCAVIGTIDGQLATMSGWSRVLDDDERRLYEEHYGPFDYEWGDGEGDPIVQLVQWNNREMGRLMDAVPDA